MELIQGITLTDELVTLDEKHFIDCLLVNCLLRYSGQDVIFERTVFRGCRHVFYGNARSTVHYLQNVGLMENGLGDWREFAEAVN